MKLKYSSGGRPNPNKYFKLNVVRVVVVVTIVYLFCFFCQLQYYICIVMAIDRFAIMALSNQCLLDCFKELIELGISSEKEVKWPNFETWQRQLCLGSKLLQFSGSQLFTSNSSRANKIVSDHSYETHEPGFQMNPLLKCGSFGTIQPPTVLMHLFCWKWFMLISIKNVP